jgi:hypothetical protein
MLVQFLTLESERNQHIMISCLFLIFIIYSLYSALYISLSVALVFMVIFGFGVYYYFKKQLKNRTVIQLQVFEKEVKQKSLKRNLIWLAVPFVIYTLLTVIHFSIVYFSGSSIVPLIYDYGLGGLFALGFSFYMNRNWSVGLCDEGLIVGSKLDARLITWEFIQEVDYKINSIEIELTKEYPLDKIRLVSTNNLQTFEKLLKYKVKS